jgi:hypothetical protein
MMLEIGLWEQALFIGGNNFSKHPRDADVVSKELFRQADLRLGHRCGNKFRDIVLLCLKGEFPNTQASGGTVMSTGLQTKFRELVVEPLRRLHLEV